MIEFCIIDPEDGREAYQWHRGFAARNEYIFPRPWDKYKKFADSGQLWCARSSSTGDYFALAYFCCDFDKDKGKRKWEVGGIMVATQERGKGLGAIITRLTLGHVLMQEDPLDRGESIIAYVHKENNEPRPILQNVLKFRLSRTTKVPGKELPGLKTNLAGEVEGDEFEIVKPDTLIVLADWCDGWNGKLKDGRDAKIVLRSYDSLDKWARAFRGMASK